MTTKLILTFFAVIPLIALSGCSKQTAKTSEVATRSGKIDGSIFIVTDGAENIKLGLLSVALYNLDDVFMQLVKANAIAETHVHKFNEDETSLFQKEQDSHKEINDEISKLIEQNGKLDTEKDHNLLEFNQIQIEFKSSLLKRTDNHFIDSFIDNRTRRQNLLFGEILDIFQSNLPSPSDVAKSDADGKFSFNVLQNGKYILAARGQRKIGDKTECYFWLVKVGLEGKPSKQIFLSNDNLITANCMDSIITLTKSDGDLDWFWNIRNCQWNMTNSISLK